jgi:hypothetical protein
VKRILLISVLALLGVPAGAQVGLYDFRAVPSGETVSVTDPDGRPCAVLRLETSISGWTFEAGLDGIMETRREKGCIYVYVPASARSVTVAHPQLGAVRNWPFPVTLQEGCTYSASLLKPVKKAVSKPVRKSVSLGDVFTVPVDSRFCQHFVDCYMGFPKDSECWTGLSYTWVGNHIGPYISVGTNFCEEYSLFGGVSWRITDPTAASLDWQIYGGLGSVRGGFGADFGVRFGWAADYQLSRWDFGFGCQLSPGLVVPTVSVGLCIWGIPVLVGIGLVFELM